MTIRALVTGFLSAFLLTDAAAQAVASPSVTELPCGTLKVLSHGASLRELLEEMAASLRFHLSYGASEAPPVHVAGQYEPLQLMQQLGHHGNIAVQYRRSTACPAQLQIASVWVVSSSPSGTNLRKTPPSSAPLPLALGQPKGSHNPGLNEYMRAHGMVSTGK